MPRELFAASESGWKQMSTAKTPLLSICIPTCNRADFLRVMLEALLPQVSKFPEEVEVWVLDNASTDQTAQVLVESAALGPFRVHRQNQNVGPTRNIVCGPAKLARGTYVWVLGDHNLLRAGALSRVLKFLRENQTYDVFYMNFRVGMFPGDWPDSAVAGFDGTFSYEVNTEFRSGPLAHWYLLLTAANAACTQNYVHVIRTIIWRDFWQSGVAGDDYTSALMTYPHTMTVIKNHLYRPVFVVAEPVLTIFNGAQSWGNPVTRVKVYLVGLSELLHTLRRHNLPAPLLAELWKSFFVQQSARVILDACAGDRRWPGLKLVVAHLRCDRRCWQVFLSVLPEILLPRSTCCFRRIVHWVKNYRNWYICNCRPARWLKRTIES